MFRSMREALGIQKPTDILDHIRNLPPGESEKAMQTIKDIERSAMVQMVPQPGLLSLMEYLEARRVRKAICTRNFDAPVAHLLENYLTGLLFEPVITREFSPPKPDPAGILFISKTWNGGGVGREGEKEMLQRIGGEGLIMVGDSIDDMKAGRAAGAATVLLRNPENEELVGHPCTDCVVDRLDELIEILENGFEEIDRTTHKVEL
ncbi:HAD-like domain-containing protein [Peziza echinospora]|nr:HAD-like domain-containing protein [Peziza echinospora]